MGISGHFGTENYEWIVHIVQNLCKYCQVFLSDFLGQNCADIPRQKPVDSFAPKYVYSSSDYTSWKQR